MINKLIITLVLSALVTAGCVRSQAQTSSDNTERAAKALAQPVETQSKLSASANGITVDLVSVSRQNNQTVVEVAMNNHVYDLTSFDLSPKTTLAGQPLASYEFIGSATGGHHLGARLIFAGELSGPLTVGLGDDFVFNLTVN